MKMLRIARMAAGLLAFAFAGGPLLAQAPKDELPHPKTLDELKKAMAEVVEKTHVPGAGVALVSHGELRTRTPIAKQLCAVSPNSDFDQGLHLTGSPSQFLSRPPVLTGDGLHPGRAPPTV